MNDRRETNAMAVIRQSGEVRRKALATVGRHPSLNTPELLQEATWGAANQLVGRCGDGCCGGPENFETYDAWVAYVSAKAEELVRAEMPEVVQREAVPRRVIRSSTGKLVDDGHCLSCKHPMASHDRRKQRCMSRSGCSCRAYVAVPLVAPSVEDERRLQIEWELFADDAWQEYMDWLADQAERQYEQALESLADREPAEPWLDA